MGDSVLKVGQPVVLYVFHNSLFLFTSFQDKRLAKDEMRVFILQAVQEGLFTEFFC